MKKSPRRLALRAQTVRSLSDDALQIVMGGGQQVGADVQGILMKDTIIIPTSRR